MTTLATEVHEKDKEGGQCWGQSPVMPGAYGPASVRVPLNEPCRFGAREYGERIVLIVPPIRQQFAKTFVDHDWYNNWQRHKPGGWQSYCEKMDL